MVLAVRAQLAQIEDRGDTRFALREVALELATMIDDPERAGEKRANLAQLQKVLDQLGPPKRKLKGTTKLATVSLMAGRRAAQ